VRFGVPDSSYALEQLMSPAIKKMFASAISKKKTHPKRIN
jgi:hypothetical protein